MLLLAFIKISQKYGSSKLAVTYVNNHLNKKNILIKIISMITSEITFKIREKSFPVFRSESSKYGFFNIY
jgi:hypothetical protein